jgi:hypothetical protein
LRRDSRVTVRITASASAMSPATWPVSPGLPDPTNPRAEESEESETGSALCLRPCGWIPGDELGVADGMILGNRLDALPAPMSLLERMSLLETPLRFGMGPSGSGVSGEALADDVTGDAEADAAAVTATVTAADGGVHLTQVTMLAVAASITEVAPVTTGICAWRSADCLSDTELTVQSAVPSPFAQPLVNVGFWLDGWATSATDTFAADPLFSVETRTV